MHCLEVIVKRNDEATMNAWADEVLDGNVKKADDIALANPDLFHRTWGGDMVPR